ncbi:hypothetical protein F5B21DRAFT_169565 [Xylaria acuta]|nr:hypothetical protein F5B21DRAFT_169565 [Xylaria acuta]
MDRFDWQQESPSTWIRALDPTELHFIRMRNKYLHHGKEWGMLSTILKLDTPIASDDFLARAALAWKWTRARHPTLASLLSDDETKRVYHVVDTTQLGNWLEETFVVHGSGTDNYAEAEHWRRSMKPVRRATLHVFPVAQELLLQTSHHQVDAHCIFNIANGILDLLDKPPQRDPEFGLEEQLLAPPPSVAAKYPAPTPEQKSRCQQEINKWVSGFPSNGIGASNVRDPPGDTRWQRMVLSSEDSAAVLAAAKSHGFTPTHVLEGAAIVAARQIEKGMKGIDEDWNSCSCGLFSLRPWCSSEFRDATAPYVTFFPQLVTPGSFMETAAQLKQHYVQWKDKGQDLLASIEPILEGFATMSSESSEPNQMLSVSSFGRLEPRLESMHGSVSLRDFVFVYETPDAGITSFSWTKQGQLSWAVCYNEAYHLDDTIAMWITLTRATLLQGLEVDGR